jgi:AcrR family transcriptional regulator
MAAKRRGIPGVRLGEPVVRAMILQGAAKVFAARGVRLAGVDDILEASRISRRTFYRVYESKEDVLLALYRLGTERLVDACRVALDHDDDLLRQAERCIDAHLHTAREQPRLVFVLGGEAQRQESLLHARRIEVHETLASMMHARAEASLPRAPDILLFRALLLALEGVTRLMLEESDEGRHVTSESLERARRVMLRVATAAIGGEGIGVAPLPSGEAEALPPRRERASG